jgi:hypothetical protein
MKSTRVILFLSVCILFQQAAAQTEYAITGNWRVDAERTFDSISVQQKAKYNSMPAAKQQEIKQSFQARTFYFYNDTRAEISFTVQNIPKQVIGSWNYEMSVQKLIINSGGKSAEYTVLWENSDHLRLVFGNTSPQGLLESLFLVRNH